MHNAATRFLRMTLTCVAVGLFTWPCFADWRQFRGNDSSSVAKDADLPVEWTDGEPPKNIAWKIELPGRGLASPIVIGGKVVVTCSSGFQQDRLHVFCFDVANGTKLWERQFWATGRTMTNPRTCGAASTPCSDGQRIFALFSSNDVACLDLDGNLQWFRGVTYDFPNCSNSLGMASSPIVIGDTLVVQTENDADSFSLGLDVESGESRWRRIRPKRANWTSPSALTDASSGETLALMQSSKGVEAVKPRTGELVWEYTNGAATIPSLVVAGDIAYVPSNGLTVLQHQAGKTVPKQLWQKSRLGPATPSPLVLGDKAFVMGAAGVLTCANLSDGEVAWQLRLEGPFTSSPVAANDRLYFFSEAGVGQVVQTGEKGELLSKNELKLGQREPADLIQGSPAIAGNALFIRSDAYLWKIANAK
jgi:outer membrane protein assembly factor BamB